MDSVVFLLEHRDHTDRFETGRFQSGRKNVTFKVVTTTEVTLLSVPGRVLARILLERVRQKLIPEKSTVDCILASVTSTERLRDFHTGLLAAYVDLQEGFDSMIETTLENLLFRETQSKLVNLISGLYSGKEVQ